MDYSKDIIFNIKYNEISRKSNDQKVSRIKRWTSSIKKTICNHTTMTIVIISCLTLIILDVFLILDFVNILQNTVNII